MITFLKSAAHALRGMRFALHGQRNIKIQLIFGAGATLLALVLPVSRIELCLVLLACAVVLCLEMVNTAVESLCDIVQPEHAPRIGRVKDIMAGAVLFASIIAAILGAVIFFPRILKLFL